MGVDDQILGATIRQLTGRARERHAELKAQGVRLEYGVEEYLLMYEIEHLYYMCHVRNIPSILHHGILSHNKVGELMHQDISLDWMQEQREKIVPVSGKWLHDYAPLYFAVRTPMQYIVTHENRWGHQGCTQDELIFIKVDPVKVFETPGVVFTDGNAGRYRAKFYTDLDDLSEVHWEYVWKGKVFGSESKLRKCAEVLVPDVIPPSYFTAVATYSEEAQVDVEDSWIQFLVSIKDDRIGPDPVEWDKIDPPVKVEVDTSLYYRK